MIVAPDAPTLMSPPYVVPPLTIRSAPLGLDARPVPLIDSGILPIVSPPVNSKAAPELTVTPDEEPNALLFPRLICPEEIDTRPVKPLGPLRFTVPVPVFEMLAEPRMPLAPSRSDSV